MPDAAALSQAHTAVTRAHSAASSAKQQAIESCATYADGVIDSDELVAKLATQAEVDAVTLLNEKASPGDVMRQAAMSQINVPNSNTYFASAIGVECTGPLMEDALVMRAKSCVEEAVKPLVAGMLSNPFCSEALIAGNLLIVNPLVNNPIGDTNVCLIAAITLHGSTEQLNTLLHRVHARQRTEAEMVNLMLADDQQLAQQLDQQLDQQQRDQLQRDQPLVQPTPAPQYYGQVSGLLGEQQARQSQQQQQQQQHYHHQ